MNDMGRIEGSPWGIGADKVQEMPLMPLKDYIEQVKREDERRKWEAWEKSQQAAKAQAKETNPKDEPDRYECYECHNWPIGGCLVGQCAIGCRPQPTVIADTKNTNPKDAIGMTKLPMHLVSGVVKAYQAIAHYLGNIKYGAWNYRAKGARASVYRAALDRHMDAWWEGEDNDPVDGTPHLANALACINILIETSVRGNMVDDRPPKSEYREVVKKMEALMPQINERYKHMKPTHFYDKGENL